MTVSLKTIKFNSVQVLILSSSTESDSSPHLARVQTMVQTHQCATQCSKYLLSIQHNSLVNPAIQLYSYASEHVCSWSGKKQISLILNESYTEIAPDEMCDFVHAQWCSVCGRSIDICFVNKTFIRFAKKLQANCSWNCGISKSKWKIKR